MTEKVFHDNSELPLVLHSISRSWFSMLVPLKNEVLQVTFLKFLLQISSGKLHFAHTGTLTSCPQEHSRSPLHCTAGDNFEPPPHPVTLCSRNVNKLSQLKTHIMSASVNFGNYHAPLRDRHLLSLKHPFVFQGDFEIVPTIYVSIENTPNLTLPTSLQVYRMTMFIIAPIQTLCL